MGGERGTMETVKYLSAYGGHQAGEEVEMDLYGPDGADALSERGIVEIVAPVATEPAAEKKPAAGKKSGGKPKAAKA